MIPVEIRGEIPPTLLQMIEAADVSDGVSRLNVATYLLNTHTQVLTLAAAGVTAKGELKKVIEGIECDPTYLPSAQKASLLFNVWFHSYLAHFIEVGKRNLDFEFFQQADQQSPFRLEEESRDILIAQHQHIKQFTQGIDQLIDELKVYRDDMQLSIEASGHLSTHQTLKDFMGALRHLRNRSSMEEFKASIAELPSQIRRKIYQSAALDNCHTDSKDPSKGDARRGKEYLFQVEGASLTVRHRAVFRAARRILDGGNIA